MAIKKPQIPATPTITAATPPPPSSPERSSADKDYFPPTTRSATHKAASRTSAPSSLTSQDDDSDPELSRARSRSRSPGYEGLRQRPPVKKMTAIREDGHPDSNGKPPELDHEHLLPPGYEPSSLASSSLWRSISRSPSPLGLIPIHRSWRQFIHKHEIPRKVLHSSIGAFTCYLYTQKSQSVQIWPPLVVAVSIIIGADVLRFSYEPFNRFYVRVLGAFMRESEYNQWNGVISYLLGVILALVAMPNDVATVSILLLSWCDTAASTIGRRYGKYTPRIRKGKSLAGSGAAFVTGVLTALLFWGYLMPQYKAFRDDPKGSHLFDGMFYTPFGGPAVITGATALAVLSLWTGMMAAFSEAVDLWGIDDNLTIPLISGLGLWGFLALFGGE